MPWNSWVYPTWGCDIKVLYISCYRDGTGYGQAATDYILSLDAAGADVVCRPLKLNNVDHRPTNRMLELEAKSTHGADVVVQHLLPHQMDYNGRMLNVALYASETTNFRSSNWAERLNSMDRAVVVNRRMVEAARRSGVSVPLSVVPHAVDESLFLRSYPTIPGLKGRGQFLFYFIGELNRRKNLPALLKAFHLEFSPAEPVGLVVKSHVPGMTERESEVRVREVCSAIKSGLKLYRSESFYKQEIVVPGRLSEEVMMSLHATCDAFVMPSRGEACCIPALVAMGMGKTPIVTDCEGFPEYLSHREGWLVLCREEPVFGETETFHDLYVGDQTWWEIDVVALRRAMREVYEDRGVREEKARRGAARVHDFSHGAVGRRLLEAIS